MPLYALHLLVQVHPMFHIPQKYSPMYTIVYKNPSGIQIMAVTQVLVQIGDPLLCIFLCSVYKRTLVKQSNSKIWAVLHN